MTKVLPPGTHVVEIRRAEGGDSPGGHPQIELALGNDEGSIVDRVVITPASLGRVVSLIDAAGLPRPKGDDVADPRTGRIADAFIARFAGRRLVITVRRRLDPGDPASGAVAVESYRPCTPHRHDTGAPVTRRRR